MILKFFILSAPLLFYILTPMYFHFYYKYTTIHYHNSFTIEFCFSNLFRLDNDVISRKKMYLFQRHRKDVSNFDRQFTSEKTDLTPTDKVFMMNLDQNEFNGFSFLNPEFVQHV